MSTKAQLQELLDRSREQCNRYITANRELASQHKREQDAYQHLNVHHGAKMRRSWIFERALALIDDQEAVVRAISSAMSETFLREETDRLKVNRS